MTEYNEEFLERFWSNVVKTDNCWLWTAVCGSKGYGQIGYKNKILSAHRVSLELALERPIREGLLVAHLPVICHNRVCVNPAHLREATPRENSLDRRLDGTMVTGKDHKASRKFTEEQIRAIRIDDRLQRIIAEDYGCCQAIISDIKSKKNYAWISD